MLLVLKIPFKQFPLQIWQIQSVCISAYNIYGWSLIDAHKAFLSGVKFREI